MILIDPPHVPGHGRRWSHLASDESFEELHGFARRLGIPERGFDRDHYDVPAELHDVAVAAGATLVSSRELAARLTAAGLRRPKAASLRPRAPGRSLLLPPPLEPGDVVAVVLPAGPVFPDRLEAGLGVLGAWGWRPRVVAGSRAGELPWLAAPDAERARAVEESWCDPEVRAVWAGRGGFGCQRLIELLDWPRMTEARPTWLVGYSDVTALHQAFADRLGVATLHAPGVAALGDAGAAQAAYDDTRELLSGGAVPPLRGTPVVGGVARGPLVGGNLAVLAASAGTPATRAATGQIAFLEDLAESPYRLDRLLTQLLRAGWFEGVRGVACGSFVDCGDPALVAEVLRLRLGVLGVPLVVDLPVGHGDANRALPLGRPATLDADAGTLTF